MLFIFLTIFAQVLFKQTEVNAPCVRCFEMLTLRTSFAIRWIQ